MTPRRQRDRFERQVLGAYKAPPQYGTSMHFPHCRDGRCTGCLPPFEPPKRRHLSGLCSIGDCDDCGDRLCQHDCAHEARDRFFRAIGIEPGDVD